MDIDAAIITGGSAITLFLLRYIVQCVCPGHISCVTRRGCCRSKPHELNPTITLQSLWEERWLPNSEGELIQDADSPRGYKKEHYAIDFHNQSQTKDRLSKFNINFIDGDSIIEIPKLFEDNNNFLNKRVCVLIDGPKKQEQLDLVKTIFNNYNNVIFIASNDVASWIKLQSKFYKNRRELFYSYDKSFFTTDDISHLMKNFPDYLFLKKPLRMGFAFNNISEVINLLDE